MAASVATGCVRCLEFHKKRALAAGITEDEILEIATLGFQIQAEAVQFNRGELDALLTDTYEQGAQESQCCGETMKSPHTQE